MHRLGVGHDLLQGLEPPFATAPSDFFSRMVVMPPALFPAEGLLSRLPRSSAA